VQSKQKPHIVVGRNINKLRMSKKMTQEQLAEGAGVDLRSLQRLEAGTWNMTVDYLERFRAALHCKWKDLMNGMD
jgi:transcriptional regulator with XRE-family HTH domain